MYPDSPEYLKKKKFFDQLLTVYGRKPCLEALRDHTVEAYRLHLADSNKPAAILDELQLAATQRNIEILYHDKKSLSRISKNAKQDQGVAVDLILKGFSDADDFLAKTFNQDAEFIALDRVTNPQNLGMIIRSICASPLSGLILPRQGCAKLDSLVIKASAGTLFRAPIIRCDQLSTCLKGFRSKGASIIGLDVNAKTQLKNYERSGTTIYVLGNESDGLSCEVKALCNGSVKIPMINQVESLNVAVTAGIIAFRSLS